MQFCGKSGSTTLFCVCESDYKVSNKAMSLGHYLVVCALPSLVAAARPMARDLDFMQSDFKQRDGGGCCVTKEFENDDPKYQARIL